MELGRDFADFSQISGSQMVLTDESVSLPTQVTFGIR